MYPVQHSTPRLSLRELTAEDVDGVLAIYGDPEATRHLSFEPRTREQVAALVRGAMVAAGAEPRTEYSLAVTSQETGDLIGFARLAMDPHQQRAATLGFALRPDVWGQGRGVETVRAVLAIAFSQLDLHRVWAARSPANTVSDKTLLRAGFVEEGRIRQHVFVHGAWRDSVTYGIVEEEWRAAL
ncbi:GNAT family N-acetyltransferase [Streptomyces lunaelactis]|uniref:GNAT family N-acetyltransferase n=1 Tax=Streptomyces lunaelactis TaxID=1535768 RepID=UPI001584900D|nr:GNAT family protein [Streptomyces lunaelactis]NUK32245.1 GNAT family N-acetyltransferase [Streptomyces lunaelactis]NUK41265.1 GNAT family N-acetyltransferase [Streptomyces lunaelactis]